MCLSLLKFSSVVGFSTLLSQIWCANCKLIFFVLNLEVSYSLYLYLKFFDHEVNKHLMIILDYIFFCDIIYNIHVIFLRINGNQWNFFPPIQISVNCPFIVLQKSVIFFFTFLRILQIVFFPSSKFCLLLKEQFQLHQQHNLALV